MIVLVAAGSLALPLSAQQSTPTQYDVAITNYQFAPQRLTVKSGDTVVWTNRDYVRHTATAIDGTWTTGTLSGKGSATKTFEKPGTYDYACGFHPDMKGTVVVEAR